MGSKFLKDFLIRNKLTYLSGILLMLLSTYVRLLYPQYLGQAADLLVSETLTETALLQLILRIIGVAAAAFVGAYFWRRLIIGNGRKLERELRTLIFKNFQALSQAFYNRRKTGDLIAYAINDVNAVRLTFGPVLIMSINGAATVAITSLNIFGTIGLRTGLVLLLPIPFAVWVMAGLGRRIRERFRLVQAAFGSISDRVNENINGIRVIKAYGQEAAEVEKFTELSAAMYDKNMAMVKVSGLLNPLVGAAFGVSFGLFFLVCTPMAVRREISVGAFITLASYLSLMLVPVASLGRIINVFQRGRASLDRINEILDYPHEITDGDGAALPLGTGSLRIQDLTFTYPGTYLDVLKNIQVTLPHGSSLGIIGDTGSGKTTLVNLLLKTYNVPSGKIFLDDQDINEFPLTVLREGIGYVPQDNFLFHDTAAENIKFFKAGYTDEAVQAAAKAAQIHEGIMELPDGYDTLLGERGVNLSGGQRQRIGIARAIIRDPQILILDDALSAVDTLTESLILNNLRTLRRGKTTIIIAHRISSVRACDEIIVMDGGEIRERGTHFELLEKGGRYGEIYESQYNDAINIQ